LSGKPLWPARMTPASLSATPCGAQRRRGYLCPYVGFSYLAPDLSGVETTGGDYNEKQSAEVMSASVIVDTIVEEWAQHARQLSTVVFAVTVEHSKQLMAKLQGGGRDGGAPGREHARWSSGGRFSARVESGQTTVLCNVGIAVEGLDIPRLKCCILARPTKSLARYIQMVGRVRRPWQGLTARIHDHAFNTKLHGLPDAERDYTLSAKPEKPPSLSTCEVCLAIYTGNQCPACSHENEVKEQAERTVETIADAEQFTFESWAGGARQQAACRGEVERPGPGRRGHAMLRKWTEQTEWGPRQFYLVQGERRQYKFPGTAHLDALHEERFRLAIGFGVPT
jgi:superfamily II DNA or RNA helicase